MGNVCHCRFRHDETISLYIYIYSLTGGSKLVKW